MSQIEWQKILWKQQPFPDNYVPDSFLSSLRKNGAVASLGGPLEVLTGM